MTSRPPMYLLTGPEELLLRRAAEKILDELRSAGELELIDLRAADLRDGGLPDLRTGSLFSTPRAVLIRDAQDLAAPLSAALAAELDAGALEATVILLATGTGRIQKLARRISDANGRIDVSPPKDWEDRRWSQLVGEEFRRHGRTADDSAVSAVIGHAGLDVGAIAEKVAQVAATAPAGSVSGDHVDAVVVGHGSRGSFAVADAMCEQQPARAVELLRGALEHGDEPVMILGALVYRLRSIVAVAGGIDPKAVGLNISPGQARRLKALRRTFGPGALTEAYRTLARADLQIKGGELPPALVIENAVITIARRA